MPSPRLAEFSASTGTGVVVDRTRAGQHHVHVNASCPRIGRTTVGVFPSERVARAAVAGIKACKHCRTTN